MKVSSIYANRNHKKLSEKLGKTSKQLKYFMDLIYFVTKKTKLFFEMFMLRFD